MACPERGRGEGGLVGLLAAAAVVGLLAVLAVASLGGSGRDGAAPDRPGLSAEVVPAAGADLDAVAGSGRALRSGVAAQSAAACAASARTLAAAAQAYQVARGSFPASPEDLVGAGLLAQVPPSPGRRFTLESSGGVPTGRVLVDGAPVEAGCAAPPGP